MSDKYSRPLSKFMGVQSKALVNEKMKRKKGAHCLYSQLVPTEKHEQGKKKRKKRQKKKRLQKEPNHYLSPSKNDSTNSKNQKSVEIQLLT